MPPQVNAFSERVPPQDLPAEQSVLGACLIDRDALARVLPLLTPESFYAEKHQYIWDAIQRAHTANAGQVDLITVQGQLNRSGKNTDSTMLDEVGGMGYLTGLVNMVPSTAGAEQYAEIVLKKARLRNLQAAARKAVDECYEADDPDLVMGDIQEALNRQGSNSGKMGLKPIAGRILDYAEQRWANRDKPNADWIPSRFADLRLKCPFLRREVTLLAMPSGHGKTTVAAADAEFQASVGYHVAFFELENADEQVFDKMIAAHGRLPVRALRMGTLDEADWFLYRAAARELNDLQTLHLSTVSDENMSSIRWQCLRLKRESGLDIVYIDFLDRINEIQRDEERYDQKVARIVGMGKAIARECNCHVVILVQIDVRVEGRLNPIPTKADMANAKTNLAAWPDNIITGVQPGLCQGDGRVKPAIYGVLCVDKRFKNTLVLAVAKGRFSEPNALVPIYAEFSTGFLGALAKPWPWHAKCVKAVKGERHDAEECELGENCGLNHVGSWDADEDRRHKEAMKVYREKALAVAAPVEPTVSF